MTEFNIHGDLLMCVYFLYSFISWNKWGLNFLSATQVWIKSVLLSNSVTTKPMYSLEEKISLKNFYDLKLKYYIFLFFLNT